MQHSTWNFDPLYKNDDDPQIANDLVAATAAHQEFAKQWQGRDDYCTDPIVLGQALDQWEELASKHGAGGKAAYYFGLRSSQETSNPTIRAKLNKVTEVALKNANTVRFFILKLGAITVDQQRVFLTDSPLQRFRPFLIALFEEAQFRLTDPEEKVFSLLSEPAYGRWTEMLEGFLAKESRELLVEGKKEQVSYGGLDKYLNDSKRSVRLVAEEAVNDILSRHTEVAENELNAVMETKKVSDELRGFAKPEDERFVDDMISQEVVAAMIGAVINRINIPHRFFKLKAQLLGLKKLSYGERNVGYGEVSARFTFDRSVEIVSSALEQLDPEFGTIFAGFVRNRQIDVYPANGKRSGAFCAFDRVDLPVYILLNHTDTLRDVTTLAHEVGHGINDELIRKHQTALYAHTPLSTAEVASTFMEDFTLSKVAEDLPPDQRLSTLISKLNDDIATIFRQVAAFQFEQELHGTYRQEGYLAKEKIGEMFQKHMLSYLGEFVDMSEENQNWWVGWHHFRRPFYVYSYASGLLISKALQEKVRRDPTFIKEVKTFLSAGISDRPEKIFNSLGLNIAEPKFWETGLDLIEESLQEAEKLASSHK